MHSNRLKNTLNMINKNDVNKFWDIMEQKIDFLIIRKYIKKYQLELLFENYVFDNDILELYQTKEAFLHSNKVFCSFFTQY